MIAWLSSLSFLLLFCCRRITQAEVLYDIVTDIKDRGPLQIRTDLQPSCNHVTPPIITTTPKTAMRDCPNSYSLETTTEKLLLSSIAPRPAPCQDTLESINSYCEFLEKTFQLTEKPPTSIPKYKNNIELHFTDNPLLKPAPAEHIVSKPCGKDINIKEEERHFKAPVIYIPRRPKCPHEHVVKPKIKTLYNMLSVLSAPSVEPVLKIKCPFDQESNDEESPLEENVKLPINQQNKLFTSLGLDNYPNSDYNNYWNALPHAVRHYLNLLPQNLEYDLPISRQKRNIPFMNGHEDLYLGDDEVNVRLPEESHGINDRIIGGKTTNSAEIPYQVALYKLDYFICGSSLISEFYILTAGHCLDDIQVSDLWFRVGSNYLLEGGDTYQVSDYTIHPNYITTDFDIAIIRSARLIKFGSDIQPIALPSFADSDLPENVKVMGSGWGATERSDSRTATYSLHKIILLTVDRETCRDRIMASKNEISKRQICTNLPRKAGMCFGDSGGPLVTNNKLVGIVSWGSPCAIGDADVYTNVREFLPWIYCTMKKLDYKHSEN